MKRTLRPQLVQYWTLAGMRPMHRALVRRTVQSMFEKANHSFSLTWHVEGLSSSETMFRPGVLIIDRDTMFDALSSPKTNKRFANEIKNRSTNQIRLLWSWSLRGRQDLLWCTELSFAGVMHDNLSVEQWCRVCLDAAHQVEIPGNFILAGIQLPMLGGK